MVNKVAVIAGIVTLVMLSYLAYTSTQRTMTAFDEVERLEHELEVGEQELAQTQAEIDGMVNEVVERQ